MAADENMYIEVRDMSKDGPPRASALSTQEIVHKCLKDLQTDINEVYKSYPELRRPLEYQMRVLGYAIETVQKDNFRTMQGHPAEPIRRKYPWNDIKEMEIARLRHLEHTQAQISRIRSAEQSQLHNRAKRDQEEIDRLRGEVASLNATINLRTQHHYPDQFFQHSNAYQENEYFRSQMSIMNRFVPGGYSHNAAYPGRSQPMAPYSSEGLYVTQPPSMAQHMRNRLSEEMQDHARRAAESTGPVANPAEPARPQAQETAPSYLPHDAAVEPMIVDGEAAADRARSGVPGTWTDRAFDESDSDGMSTKAVYEAPVNGDRGTVAACGDLDNEDMSDDSGTVC